MLSVVHCWPRMPAPRLDEIEQVSNQIASLVQNISGSARQQAGSAADVTRRTSKLKEISDANRQGHNSHGGGNLEVVRARVTATSVSCRLYLAKLSFEVRCAFGERGSRDSGEAGAFGCAGEQCPAKCCAEVTASGQA